MSTYEELAKSRREWIDEMLIPWCRTAERRELLKAEQDWTNIAGRVDPEMSLWTWAWSRFPALVHPEMSGIDETREVCVRLKDGRELTGFPDARRSLQGELYLLCNHAEAAGEDHGPVSIDDVAAAEQV